MEHCCCVHCQNMHTASAWNRSWLAGSAAPHLHHAYSRPRQTYMRSCCRRSASHSRASASHFPLIATMHASSAPSCFSDAWIS